jgi:hypothetical protein
MLTFVTWSDVTLFAALSCPASTTPAARFATKIN